jgi:hypothetical protein
LPILPSTCGKTKSLAKQAVIAASLARLLSERRDGYFSVATITVIRLESIRANSLFEPK